MGTPFWIDIEIELVDTNLRITARGCRGEVTTPRLLPIGSDRLESFARKVGRAVKAHGPLDEPTLREAQDLHAALFEGEFRDLHMRLIEAAKGAPVLHRLVLRHRELQAVPWEALCEPATTEGFWSTSSSKCVVRGVASPEPWKPREVTSAVRLLLVAPGFEGSALLALHNAIADPIAAGEIEWLEPIVGPRASLRLLFDCLRRTKRPHILHYIGHGGLDTAGNPVLRLADNEDGEEEWIRVESLARELSANLSEHLRLVVLEACDGARPGLLGSAAEVVIRAGIDAVIAHLWPVRADVASMCSRGVYKALTGLGTAEGNVATSLADVRRSLLLHGAEAFSPILYLRGTVANIFDFQRRTLPPDTTPTSHVTSTLGQGTFSLSGELMPVWKDGSSKAGRLRFEHRREDKTVVFVDQALVEPKTYYIGRKELRSDRITPNDFVLPSGRVSQDAASIEAVGGRFWIRNTSDKARVFVNMVPIQPGDARALYHGCTVMIADVPGVFFDGRYFHAAPMSAVDPQTGLLSREGLTCEVSAVLAARKSRALLMLQFAPDDANSASVAAQSLHAAEPAAAVGRIDGTVGMLVESQSDMESRINWVRRAGVSPLAVGFLDLSGPRTEAGVRVDAAIGALTRIASAGGTDAPVDLARYALAVVSLGDLAQFARDARTAGGGMGLLLLDELERYGALGEASRAAIELELREQLGALLGPADRIASVGPGAVAVATRQPVDRLLRDFATTWRMRGPILVGALELDRGLRVFVLDEPTAAQLVTQPAAFLRDVSAGTNAHGLPMPIAYWLAAAHLAGTTLERATALTRTVEATWRFLGCVVVAALWSTRKGGALNLARLGASWDAWPNVTVSAAELLRAVEGRLGELAEAICKASVHGLGALAIVSERAKYLSLMLSATFRDERVLEQATTALELSLHEAFAALRSLQGWTLVAVRQVEPLDTTETARVVDYMDFTGPHMLGVQRRNTVCGMRIAEFVYLVRWAEGLAIPLEPLVRRVRVPGSNGDGLAVIESIPAAPGLHGYCPVSWEGRIELHVTARQLAR